MTQDEMKKAAAEASTKTTDGFDLAAMRDHREVAQDGRVFCAPCAGSAYFSNSREINWPDMNWTP